MKNSQNKLIYKLVSSSVAKTLSTLNTRERIVYKLILSNGTNGMWHRDLRHKSNIESTYAMAKIIKNLIKSKLIKIVPSPDGSNRKTYMLYNLRPTQKEWVNSFNSGHSIDSELVEKTYNACYDFICMNVLIFNDFSFLIFFLRSIFCCCCKF
ncbi:DNA-directed RNA polymerase III subunit RPC6, partial [Bonamia ostreae]